MQVYLAKWQETDVAVKVVSKMQNLSPKQGIHPQDPDTMACPQMSLAGRYDSDQTGSHRWMFFAVSLSHRAIIFIAGTSLSSVITTVIICH